MSNKRKKLKWITIILSLLSLQTLTYFTIGQRLLKNKLIPTYFTDFGLHSDSIFVRDFYVPDSHSDFILHYGSTYLSHDLSKDKEFIKKGFNVDYAYFKSHGPEHLSDTTEKNFNLAYYTWIERPHWSTFFGFFGVRQVEMVLRNKKYLYGREITYHWILFFWLPTFEIFTSTDLSINNK